MCISSPIAQDTLRAKGNQARVGLAWVGQHGGSSGLRWFSRFRAKPRETPRHPRRRGHDHWLPQCPPARGLYCQAKRFSVSRETVIRPALRTLPPAPQLSWVVPPCAEGPYRPPAHLLLSLEAVTAQLPQRLPATPTLKAVASSCGERSHCRATFSRCGAKPREGRCVAYRAPDTSANVGGHELCQARVRRVAEMLLDQ